MHYLNLKDELLEFGRSLKLTTASLGCDVLIKLNKADDYFKNVFIILDNDIVTKSTYLEYVNSQKNMLALPGDKSFTSSTPAYLRNPENIIYSYLKDKLDLDADWSHVLSVGEQQRLAFVRAHIQQPQWLFLDEATSALDEDTEATMYSLLQERLQQTTVVSVGHRSTLNKYHELVLRLNKSTRQVTLEKL